MLELSSLEIFLICLSFYLWITTIVATVRALLLLRPNVDLFPRVLVAMVSPILFPILWTYVEIEGLWKK